MHDINQEELIIKYDITNGKEFTLKDINYIIQNCKLTKYEESLIDKQVIKYYCQYCNIDINYNLKPSDQNNAEEITVAMFLALNKIIPYDQWFHDPTLRNKNNQTVGIILSKYGIIPPEKWYYHIQHPLQPCIEISYDLIKARAPPASYFYRYRSKFYPTIFSQACFKEIPNIKDHKPEEQDDGKWTVAMILAYQGIVPPKQWMHPNDIQNNYKRNLEYYLKSNNLPVPLHWNDNDIDIFDKACYGEIPELEDHYPEEQNEQGETIAMILTKLNIGVPIDWIHDPEIQNFDGETVALIQAKSGRIPSKHWEHNKWLRCKCVKESKFIERKFYQVGWPEHSVQYNIYEDLYEYDTVQDILQKQGIQVQEQWKYEYKDDNQNTEPMIQASKGLIPIKQDFDDEMQTNKNGDTVALILARQGIVPPDEWMHDIFYQNFDNESIKSLLQYNDYIYKNDKFILKYKIQNVSGQCQICQQQCQKFVQTRCGHKICLQCFKELELNKIIKKCPICKQNNWYFEGTE